MKIYYLCIMVASARILKSWTSIHQDQMDALGAELAALSDQLPSIWLFRGDLGAGKTSLIRCIAKHLGVLEPVQSPSFSLINSYSKPSGAPIHHSDLYRIKSLAEALDLGLEEYLDSGDLCWVEWPEMAEELWTMPHAEFQLSSPEPDARDLTLRLYHES